MGLSSGGEAEGIQGAVKMRNSECKPERKRRHRADLSGFKIEIVPAEKPSPQEEVYRALHEAFEEWRSRREQAEQEPETEGGGGNIPPGGIAVEPR